MLISLLTLLLETGRLVRNLVIKLPRTGLNLMVHLVSTHQSLQANLLFLQQNRYYYD